MHIKASWSSQMRSPMPPSKVGSPLDGRGSSLYHDVLDGDAQGTSEVKKLSKQSDRAADQAQMNRTSERVWASLAEVRQRPNGRPKYSS